MKKAPEHSSPSWGPTTKLVVALTLAAIIIGLVIQFHGIIAPLLMALVLAYLLNPDRGLSAADLAYVLVRVGHPYLPCALPDRDWHPHLGWSWPGSADREPGFHCPLQPHPASGLHPESVRKVISVRTVRPGFHPPGHARAEHAAARDHSARARQHRHARRRHGRQCGAVPGLGALRPSHLVLRSGGKRRRSWSPRAGQHSRLCG